MLAKHQLADRECVWCAHLKPFYSGSSRTVKELPQVPGDRTAKAVAGVVAHPVIKPLTLTTAVFNVA